MKEKLFVASMVAVILHLASEDVLAQQNTSSPSNRVLPIMGSVVPAKYPMESKAAKEEGVVKVRVTVDRTGWTTDVRLVNSSGYPRLDAAAIDAARHWRYRPGTVAGVPTAMSVDLPVRFALNGRSALKETVAAPTRAPEMPLQEGAKYFRVSAGADPVVQLTLRSAELCRIQQTTTHAENAVGIYANGVTFECSSTDVSAVLPFQAELQDEFVGFPFMVSARTGPLCESFVAGMEKTKLPNTENARVTVVASCNARR